MELTGYSSLSILYQGTDTKILKGIRDKDSAPVIIKILDDLNPSLDHLLAFKHEFYVLEKLKNIDCVPTVLGLEKNNGYWMIVQADFSGQPLSHYIETKPFNLLDFLKTAIKLTDALNTIHKQGLIHKDINPHNIILEDTGDIKIIDFGLCSDLATEQQSAQKDKTLSGTLKYISPEQTGRMNRSIDYRTDFYSLGLTFYNMLTGGLPFNAEDPIELIYQHLAKAPKSLHAYDNQIPETISSIVDKLLQKNAEDRYQTAYGILHDLKRALFELQKNNAISGFSIAEKDLSDQFSIPQKLFGREEAVADLLNGFESLKFHNQPIIAISGKPGIGKSFLIQEIYKPITKLHSYFFRGKFDEYERNIPYLGLSRLFKDFVQQILMEPNDQILKWKNEILNAVGINAKILTDIVPEMEKIIGPQEVLLNVDPQAAEKRFIITVKNFFQIFDRQEHPIAIFLDDMQWADSLTLKSMEACIFNTTNILYIFSYRSNEVLEVHPFKIFLDEINLKFNIKFIDLAPLDINAIQELLQETLHTKEGMKELAKVINDKTRGNPFYLKIFLTDLYKKGMIWFNYDNQRWDVDIESINKIEITENVVASLLMYMASLPKEVSTVLSVAACIGNTFSLTTLSLLLDIKPQEIGLSIKRLLSENYIIPLDNNYRYALDPEALNSNYAFSHDKVREAAYSLLSPEKAQEYHYKLGKILMTNSNTLETDVIEMVDHLNKAGSLVSGELREQLKKLNLLAGRKARAAQAYHQALNYFENGIVLLDKQAWKSDYETTLGLYTEAAEVSGYLAENSKSERYSKIAIENAKSTLDLVKIYHLGIYLEIANSHPREALKNGVLALKKLNYNLPLYPKPWHIIIAIIKANIASKKIPVDEIVHLPTMTDERIRAIASILHEILTSAIQVRPLLFVVMLSHLFRLNIKYGLSETSPLAFVSYGILCAGIFQNFQKAQAYGTLGYNLGFRFKNSLPLTGPGYCGFINHTTHPYKDNLPILKNCYDVSIETGNTEFALLSLIAQAVINLQMGARLDEVYEKILNIISYAKQLKQEFIIRYILVHAQAIDNLLYKSENISKLDGQFYHDEVELPSLIKNQDVIGVIFTYFLKINLAFLMRDYDLAESYLVISRPYSKRLLSHLYFPLYLFYDILTTAQIYPTLNIWKKFIAHRHIAMSLKKLKKFAVSSPKSYADKYSLALAELSKMKGEFKSASLYYDQALSAAKENGYIQMEAIINELAAQHYFNLKLNSIGNLYLLEAYIAYSQWGCVAKIKQFEKLYPWLLEASAIHKKSRLLSTHKTTSSENESKIDYLSAMKASITVANETSLPALISQLFYILTENIGAERCVLLLMKGDHLYIEGDYSTQSGMRHLLSSIFLTQQTDLVPFSVIQYVANTNETVSTADPHIFTKFHKDKYLENDNARSFLCSPLLHQKHLIGVLYFESSVPNAFTPNRLEFLNVLSSQISISINNARLYQSLGRFVPHQFLNLLGKPDILDVKIGDSAEKVVTVFFADIRGFTTFSEQNEASKVFALLNLFLSQIEPIIAKYNGFIDKYIGDAIMALFPDSPLDALKASIDIQRQLVIFNQQNHTDFRLGIGLNTGPVMIGTLGSENRMDGTVISDTVNTASRIESLTKDYNIMLLISDETKSRLQTSTFKFRYVDTVSLRGRAEKTILWEVIDI